MQPVRIAGGRIGAALLLLAPGSGALAWTVTITASSPKAVYLQIGVGSLTGTSTYNNGGTPGNTATINKASVTVPAASLGNKTAQAMTTDSGVDRPTNFSGD